MDEKRNSLGKYDVWNRGFGGDCVYKVCEGNDEEVLMIRNEGLCCFDYGKGSIGKYLWENGLGVYWVKENGLLL